jgi:septum formation protein
MPRLILASSSPRRPALLRHLTEEFSVESVPVEEVAPRALSVGDAVEVIASKKALAVSARHPEAHVLAADTVVVLGDELVDKAHDVPTLRAQLAMLAGGTHQVWTGLALAWNGKALGRRHAVTAVHVDRIPREVVDAYAASGAWQGKAGGYGIQDKVLAPYVRIQAGPWSNVVGLPLAQTADLLRSNGVKVRDPPDEEWLRQRGTGSPSLG